MPQTSHPHPTLKSPFQKLSGETEREGEKKVFPLAHLFTHLFYNDRSWLSEQTYKIERGMPMMPVLFSKAHKKMIF